MRPAPHQPDDFEPGCERGGWQHEAASRVEELFRDGSLFSRLDDVWKVLMRSIGSGMPFVSGHSFGAVSVSSPSPSPSSAFHLILVATTAQLVLELGFSVAARICREAGGRVTTNVMVRDMDLVRPDVHDTRRLEVVVDGLSLFGGVQLAVDTTVVSALHANGSTAFGSSSPEEGAHLSGADRQRRKGQVGCTWG